MQNGSIEVGDVVVLQEGRRGRVILASKGGKYLLLRLNTTPAGAEPAYLLCGAREARRINSWWNARRKRGAFPREERSSNERSAA